MGDRPAPQGQAQQQQQQQQQPVVVQEQQQVVLLSHSGPASSLAPPLLHLHRLRPRLQRFVSYDCSAAAGAREEEAQVRQQIVP